jgi:hypothetical protein
VLCRCVCVCGWLSADDSSIEFLCKCVADSKAGRITAPLRRVCVDRNELTHKALRALLELFALSPALKHTLTHLSLAKNNLNDEAVSLLAQRVLAPAGSVLDASGAVVVPQSAVSPAPAAAGGAGAGAGAGGSGGSAAAYSGLMHLDLHDNLIADAGAVAVAKAVTACGERCALLTLDLSGNTKMSVNSGAALSHMVRADPVFFCVCLCFVYCVCVVSLTHTTPHLLRFRRN